MPSPLTSLYREQEKIVVDDIVHHVEAFDFNSEGERDVVKEYIKSHTITLFQKLREEIGEDIKWNYDTDTQCDVCWYVENSGESHQCEEINKERDRIRSILDTFLIEIE